MSCLLSLSKDEWRKISGVHNTRMYTHECLLLEDTSTTLYMKMILHGNHFMSMGIHTNGLVWLPKPILLH